MTGREPVAGRPVELPSVAEAIATSVRGSAVGTWLGYAARLATSLPPDGRPAPALGLEAAVRFNLPPGEARRLRAMGEAVAGSGEAEPALVRFSDLVLAFVVNGERSVGISAAARTEGTERLDAASLARMACETWLDDAVVALRLDGPGNDPALASHMALAGAVVAAEGGGTACARTILAQRVAPSVGLGGTWDEDWGAWAERVLSASVARIEGDHAWRRRKGGHPRLWSGWDRETRRMWTWAGKAIPSATMRTVARASARDLAASMGLA